MPDLLLRLLVIALLPAILPSAELFRDDFYGFPAGHLSQPMGQLNGAIQECHYIEHRIEKYGLDRDQAPAS